uniref:F-box domain-containing protein n=1 Tax=Caenorhabditis tropicalis TaxID=1561998 RepID=A0A1I7U7L8_9PELO
MNSKLENSPMNSFPKPPPNLCDLPVEIVEMIVKNLDLPRRVIVGRVCKTLLGIANQLESPRVNDIKITVGSEGCEMKIEGYPIKYGKPDEESLDKMMNDLVTFVPDFQLNTVSFRFNDSPSQKLFRSQYLKRVSQPMKVQKLVIKMFNKNDHIMEKEIVNSSRIIEYRFLEKLEDDFIKLKVVHLECVERIGTRWITCLKDVYHTNVRDVQDFV